MSTKKIREALEMLKAQAIGSPTLAPYVDSALAEVEAIEAAARELVEHGDDARSSAWQLMECIATASGPPNDPACPCPPRPYWPPGSMVAGSEVEKIAHEKWEREHGSHEAAKRRDEEDA